MLLSEARTEVLAYLDDDGTRFSNTRVDFALKAALRALVNIYTQKGGDALTRVIEAVTNSNGYVDLSAYRPLAIDSVGYKVSSYYRTIPQIRPNDRTITNSSGVNVRITLVSSPSFPSSAATAFDYGPGASTFASEAFDNLLVILAVKQLSTIDGERHLIASEQEQLFWEAVLADTHQSRAYEIQNTTGLLNLRGYDYVWSQEADRIYISHRLY